MPKILSFGGVFVKADLARREQPSGNFFPNETSSLAARPKPHRRRFKLGGQNETTPKLFLPTALPRPSLEKGLLLPRGGHLSAPGRKERVFFGAFSLRVMGWRFTFGLNFRSHLPQRRLFNTCSLVPTSSSLRGARR